MISVEQSSLRPNLTPTNKSAYSGDILATKTVYIPCIVLLQLFLRTLKTE